MHIARLTRIEPITSLTWRFFFEVQDRSIFSFIPGQFVTLDLPIGSKPKERWRSYSIASAPNETNSFELVIVKVDGGRGTQYLFENAKPGTTLPFMGPLGKFVLPEKIDREICFICTGTGIAPFRSMLHHLHESNRHTPPLHLVFGTRQLSDVLYREELKSLSQAMPQLSYYITLSRETKRDAYHGYVHGLYESLFADGRPADFYLCGWKNMIDEARTRIAAMGYSRSHIHLEIYG